MAHLVSFTIVCFLGVSPLDPMDYFQFYWVSCWTAAIYVACTHASTVLIIKSLIKVLFLDQWTYPNGLCELLPFGVHIWTEFTIILFL